MTLIAIERQNMKFLAVFSQYLKTMIDVKKFSVAETILMISPTKVIF